MITDLLVAGLLVASSADLAPAGGGRPATAGAHPASQSEVALACADPRASDRAALLEAHAGYAALPPFSLARAPLPAAPRTAPDGKGAPPCKS